MIRPYQLEDKAAVLELLHLNTPKYFHTDELHDFMHYLDNETESYFVLEQNNKVVGCAGINYFPDTKIARLSWDIIHPEYQNQGLGKLMSSYRIEHIKDLNLYNQIVVRTSQLSYVFYEKIGFTLEFIENDYWAKDLHLYQMSLPLKIEESE